MSTLVGFDHARRERKRAGMATKPRTGAGALRAQAAGHAVNTSPTTSIGKALLAIATALLVALLLSARGVVHAGEGMDDGTARTVTLAIGNAALNVAEATHLTWPWDRLSAALGHPVQPAIPPLLASGGGLLTPPAPRHVTTAPRRTTTAPAVSAPPRRTHTASAVSVRPSSAPRHIHTAPPVGVRTSSAPPRRVHAVSAVTGAPVVARTHAHAAGPPRRPAPPRSHRPSPAQPAIRTGLSSRPEGHHLVNSRVTAPPRRTPAGALPGASHRRPPASHKTPPAPAGPPRVPTAADPLRLLVTGDSLPGYLGPQLVNALSAVGPVRGFVDVHDGTGLTRPDFVDWSVVARQQVAADNPDAVVVWMGGNDFQNMTLPNGAFFQAGTPAWTREYQRRAEICMRIWAQNDSHRVYWLSMPPARDPTWAYDDNQINIALQRAAAAVPGAEYLDILGPITDHGRYTDYVTVDGQPVLVRESDGVHVNIAGSQIVAQEVLPVLEREWRIGYKPPAAPTATPRPSPTRAAVAAHPSPTPGRPPAPTPTPRVTQPAHAKPSAPATGPPAFITVGDSPTHPATVFHAGLLRLYGWVRDSALPAGARNVGFVWVRLPDRVIDRYTLARSRQAYTGGYETAAAAAPGAYRCEIVVGGRMVASAAYTVVK